MTKLLQSTWTAAAIGAVSFLLSLVLFWRQIPPPPPPTTSEEPTPAGSGFTLSSNPEINLLIADLQQRNLELEAREQKLNDLQARLQAEAAELSAITQHVAQLQTAFDQQVLRIQEEESVNLKKLAKTYSAMPPDKAAEILRHLDDDALVKILAFMKEEDAAGLLQALAQGGNTQAQRVADLSEKLRMTLRRQPAAQG